MKKGLLLRIVGIVIAAISCFIILPMTASAVSFLTVVALSPHSIQATWTEDSSATYYELQCCQGNSSFGESNTVSGTTTDTSYTFDNLNYNTRCFLRVRAHYADSVSAWSSISQCYTQILAVPNGLQITTTYTTLSVSWSPVAHATAYVIQYGINSSSTWEEDKQIITSDTSCTFEGLTCGTRYFIRVKAIDETSSGNFCSPQGVRLPVPVATSIKSGTAIGITALNIELTPHAEATSYTIQIQETSSSFTADSTTITTESTSHIFSDLKPRTKYWFRMCVNVGTSSSAWTSPVAFVTPGLAAPAGYTAVSNTPTSITVSWNPVDCAQGYAVLYGLNSNVSESIVTDADTTTCTITGLTPGTRYFYRVKATHSLDESITSVIGLYTKAMPAVTNFSATADTFATINLSWEAAEGISTYWVQYDTSPQFSNPVTESVSATAYTIQGLNPNTQYYCRVCATSEGYAGAWCAYRAVKTPIMPAPTELELVETTDSTIKVSWADVPFATGYLFMWCSRTAEWDDTLSFTVATTEAEVTGLQSSTLYDYKVKALYKDGISSEWSTVGSAQTDAQEVTSYDFLKYNEYYLGNNLYGYGWNLYHYDNNCESFVRECTLDDLNISDTTYLKTDYLYGDSGFYVYFPKLPEGQTVTITDKNNNPNSMSLTATGIYTSQPIETPYTVDYSYDGKQFTWIWSEVADAASYVFEYSTDGYFVTDVTTIPLTATQYIVTFPRWHTTYFMRVKAIPVSDNDLDSEWTSVMTYSTPYGTCTVPVVTIVNNGASTGELHATWEPIEGARAYYVFAGSIMSGEITGTSVDLSALQPGESLSFQVQALGNSDFYDSSFTEEVTVYRADVQQTVLDTPQLNNLSTIDANSVAIEFNLVDSATAYIIEYSTYSDFSIKEQLEVVV